MQENKVMLLAQLVEGLREAHSQLEESYLKNNKKSFDSSKKALLDFQNKISYLLKQK